MKCIIKLFPEITIKSKSVRLHFIKVLVKNIFTLFKKHGFLLFPIRHWDYIELRIENDNLLSDIIRLLVFIPGIHQVLLVKEYFFNTINDIGKEVLVLNYDRLIGKCFCVRVKRRGRHNFTSQDVERYVGSCIKKNVSNTYVKLVNPEVTIFIEINENRFFVIVKRYQGLGGFPLGTQENVLSLFSGGFDSAVASYMLMRRGCKVSYCFFNFGATSNEIGVSRIANYLWNKFASSHKVQFFFINFVPIVNEIIQKVSASITLIVLKRMMLRVASSIAIKYRIQALVTGESIGQVSSQTLTNLRLIDNAANIITLRPLIAHDKEQIISLAKYIGVEKMVNMIPEYCSFFSKKPTARGIQVHVEQQEKKINVAALNEVLTQVKIVDICDVILINKQNLVEVDVEVTSKVGIGEIILDIRSQEDQDIQPLNLANIIIQKIPFYKLVSQFDKLNPNQIYLLYCNHGTISALQASYLYSRGFRNIKIYRPDKQN
ncbi:tRNA uracil 4-sulfurtransferase ThiI [Blochmannia endosymbiont of Camponotus (Colobopsis) obliquus]|uniref:tRNA uracil 4-sulfurtransferase ThiI n=1 Tax=Blochmannia endosymbiont of Camponotus (Colobopsis) obliquus TaxID=1505597 RepID=UPI00061A6338|nr:tRNA uracil 4-sulfurtransferase ThiI [Blochmannia endosymbiont of Camponotus (Colobopsis) obliquus]AKC60403.1 tRNA sulfurtransferase [Blochmannia endosymbiont of Camponotus (Colobopsis) obliquus]